MQQKLIRIVVVEEEALQVPRRHKHWLLAPVLQVIQDAPLQQDVRRDATSINDSMRARLRSTHNQGLCIHDAHDASFVFVDSFALRR